MRKSLIVVLLLILILVSCASNPAVIIPQVEKYCPRPVRPILEQKDTWTIQDLLQMNMTIIDYTLKLESTVSCYENK